jgi:hypothetical protein
MYDNPSSQKDFRHRCADNIAKGRLFARGIIRIFPSVEVLELGRTEDKQRVWIIRSRRVREADDALEALASQSLPRKIVGAGVCHTSQRRRLFQHPVELLGGRETGDFLHAPGRHQCYLHKNLQG